MQRSHTDKPFTIDKAYYYKLQNKIETYRKVTKTKKEIFLALILSSGLKPNAYSDLLVSKVATLEDLFNP
ncbi:MAG: hypothetical protein S4CHLAM123_11760 [Chlamydiales bacterium]|nr:hypothetical protein [Chlamydiales bacterium]